MDTSTKHLFFSVACSTGSEIRVLFEDGRVLNGRVKGMIDHRFAILRANILFSSSRFLIDLKGVIAIAAK